MEEYSNGSKLSRTHRLGLISRRFVVGGPVMTMEMALWTSSGCPEAQEGV